MEVSKELEEIYNNDAPRLVKYYITKYTSTIKIFGSWEDAYQSLLLQIWRVMPKFDRERSKFTTFALYVCKMACYKEYRKQNASKRKHVSISVDAEIDEEGHTIADVIGEEVDIEDVIAKEDIVEDVILKLHPMAYDYYINELSQKELSAKYNLSQAYISRIISKNINRIRTQMFMDEFIDNKGEILWKTNYQI